MLKRIVPFIVALLIGIALSFIFHIRQPVKTKQIPVGFDATGLTILSVPRLDFTDAARRTGGFSGSMSLTALFKSDGKVSTVQPVLMIPYGMSEKEYISRYHEHPTAARLNGKAVEELPYGLTEVLMKAVDGIQFIPMTRGGQLGSAWLSINADFDLITSPDCIGCSSITLTITDMEGVKWREVMWCANAYWRESLRR